MLYAVNYDLKQPGRNYSGLYEAIKSCGDYWHYLGSTWLVDTHLNAEGIATLLRRHLDANDYLLVVGITKETAGWLPTDAWTWLYSRKSWAA